uniref:Uncharacterized protein n=1 Tax=Avena sativa TaxID=4498 RepID=A0ACD5VBH7_AVESA
MSPCKRRCRAAGKAGTDRRRAAKVDAPEVERPAGVPAKDRTEEVVAEAEAPGVMEVGDAGRTAIGVDGVCPELPNAEDMSLATAAAEPSRSTRRRRKSAALMEAEADAEHERRKRRCGAVGAARRRRAAKDDKPKEPVGVLVAGAAGMMEVDGAVCRTAIREDDVCAEEPDAEAMRLDEEEAEAAALEAEEHAMGGAGTLGARKRVGRPRATERRVVDGDSEDHFVGDPVPEDEARRRWPERYTTKDCAGSHTRRSDEEITGASARCHYRTACVDDHHFDLGDDVYLKVISPKLLDVHDHTHDRNRLFLSEEKDDNMIESIISKANISYVRPNMTDEEKSQLISKSDFYYDMFYSVACSTFANIPAENGGATSSEATSEISCDDPDSSKETPIADFAASPEQVKTATLLDLYAGCGAMSTGLCLGAALSGIKLNTQWAVDLNTHACNSLKRNNPCTQVRNEKAEDFLSLLRQWEVRWKTCDPSQDTWEPVDGLSDSPECIKEFVVSGYKESILPLPGCVDVICGGPPCQGITGLNRFRKLEDPLNDERNKQLVVFMDIVKYLRPKYVLMENVVDILKFADGFLGRYALSRLVALSYQARLGMMVAGCYGLPQFRMRAFLWGALPSVVLPKFPLPTHDVVKRGLVPKSFSQCLVAYTETEDRHLEKALVLRDAISDLPKVGIHLSYYTNDRIPTYIRLSRKDMLDYSFGDAATPNESQLFDHQPLQLNKDDYERVQQIPMKKGANFRDLKGVQVGAKNTVEFIPDFPRAVLPSGKPLVPPYAMTFMKGKSTKPFGRLWWDETVPTVVTRAEPHNQIILHPTQHRVLTVRENARLQGFPDYYRLFGPIKQKYIQVGNAVAVPVARALGYSFGQAYQGEFHGDQPLFKLPRKFIPMNQATETRATSVGTSVGEAEKNVYSTVRSVSVHKLALCHWTCMFTADRHGDSISAILICLYLQFSVLTHAVESADATLCSACLTGALAN